MWAAKRDTDVTQLSGTKRNRDVAGFLI
jgi:hypothetical protein